jgi:AraC-like DNA-binding protein
MSALSQDITFRTASGISFTVAPRQEVLLERPDGFKVTMMQVPGLDPDYALLSQPVAVSIIALTQYTAGQRYEGHMLGRRFLAQPRLDGHTVLPAGSDSIFRGPASEHRYVAANFPKAWLGALALEHDLPGAGQDLAPRVGAHEAMLAALSEVMRTRYRAQAMTPGFVDHWATLVALTLLRLPGERGPDRDAPLSDLRLRLVKEYIEAQLEGDVSLHALSRLAGLSAWHFARCFRASTGLAPHAFVTQRRVARALELLGTGSMALSEVAQACGFSAQSQFTTSFKRAMGVTPGAWRREAGGDKHAVLAASRAIEAGG